MKLVILTALGVGGATIFGAVIGMLFKESTRRFAQIVLAFSAGIMLSASVFGLIIPALEAGKKNLPIAIIGILSGAITMNSLECLVNKKRPNSTNANRVYLFVAAIAIHNLPEGLAAGVGFGTGNPADALLIAGGIALQNFPEGMVIIAPMLSTGLTPAKTLFIGLCTGLIEVIGTFLGYFAITAATALLPFALSFAGGTMLFIICAEMIPDVCCGSGSKAAYSLLIGFCVMLSLSTMLK